jgi:hypothetical protein
MPLRLFLLLGIAWLCTAFAEAQVTAPIPSPAARPAIATDAWYRTWVRVDDTLLLMETLPPDRPGILPRPPEVVVDGLVLREPDCAWRPGAPTAADVLR